MNILDENISMPVLVFWIMCAFAGFGIGILIGRSLF